MTNVAKVTIADIARVANVSKMSVSRVLNGQPGVSEETRKRIMQTVEALGYVSNASQQRRLKIIGLVAPDITASYMGEVIRGISQAAERLSYSLVLCTQGHTDHVERTTYYASLLSNSLASGVLMIVPLDYEVLVEIFKEQNLPYVLIDHHSNTDDEPAITATNRKGIMDAMRYLMALGHQRIGFITGRMDMGCSQDRLQGYRDALTEVGLPFDPELVCEGDFVQATGFTQATALLRLNMPPTAIVASNDMMAFGVMDAIKDTGKRVGSDISVVGFDDIPMASQVHPALTTVRQPLDLMGEVGIDLLTTLIEGRQALTLRRELPTELIVRESTGRVQQR